MMQFWQIAPRVLTEAMTAGGEEARHTFEPMMAMQMVDVAAFDTAHWGQLSC